MLIGLLVLALQGVAPAGTGSTPNDPVPAAPVADVAGTPTDAETVAGVAWAERSGEETAEELAQAVSTAVSVISQAYQASLRMNAPLKRKFRTNPDKL
jgi:hypothetical protein